MRVLHLISSAGWYGAENVLVNLAAASRRLGCDATAGILRDARNPHTEVAEHGAARGVPSVIFQCQGRLDLGTMAAVRRHLAEQRVDVLHTHGYKANFYAARRGHTPLVTTCHTGTEQAADTASLRIYDAINGYLLRRADRLVAVSPAIAEALRAQGYAAARVAMIANGIDAERFERPRQRWPGLPETGVVVGAVGRLIREKGLFVLLEAARAVVAKAPETCFLLVGEGPDGDELRRAAAEAGLGAHFVFAGAQSEMPAVYASMDVLAQPSFREGMPMTVLEAMAAGLPVVASRIGAMPELLEPAACGLVCPAGDAGALAAALLRLVNDTALAQRMGAAGRAHLRAHYSAEAMARRYLELYAAVCRGREAER